MHPVINNVKNKIQLSSLVVTISLAIVSCEKPNDAVQKDTQKESVVEVEQEESSIESNAANIESTVGNSFEKVSNVEGTENIEILTSDTPVELMSDDVNSADAIALEALEMADSIE